MDYIVKTSTFIYLLLLVINKIKCQAYEASKDYPTRQQCWSNKMSYNDQQTTSCVFFFLVQERGKTQGNKKKLLTINKCLRNGVPAKSVRTTWWIDCGSRDVEPNSRGQWRIARRSTGWLASSRIWETLKASNIEQHWTISDNRGRVGVLFMWKYRLFWCVLIQFMTFEKSPSNQPETKKPLCSTLS